MLKVDLGAVNSKTVTVNKDVWNKLPDEVKTILQKVALEYRDHVAGIAMDRASSSLDAYVAGGGTVVEMSQEARQAWADSMPNIAVDWAKKLDTAGAPGSDMLKAYIAKLKAAGFTPLRDWAAEL
jgi:C4-dicarboxylate-binding protein DctP